MKDLTRYISIDELIESLQVGHGDQMVDYLPQLEYYWDDALCEVCHDVASKMETSELYTVVANNQDAFNKYIVDENLLDDFDMKKSAMYFTSDTIFNSICTNENNVVLFIMIEYLKQELHHFDNVSENLENAIVSGYLPYTLYLYLYASAYDDSVLDVASAKFNDIYNCVQDALSKYSIRG